MSAARASVPTTAQPSSGTQTRKARPPLRVVAPVVQSRSRVPFVLVCVAILTAALLSVLLLNTSMAAGAYKEQELRSELARLDESAQTLNEQIDAKRSPGQLAEDAAKLGMVRSPHPAYLRLSDQTVLGEPVAAE